MDGASVLTQDFHADGALASDDVRVVIGVHECGFFFLGECDGMLIGVIVRVAMQGDRGAMSHHCIDLDLGSRDRHDDGCGTIQFPGSQRHTLRMVAGRSCDDTSVANGRRQFDHLVVGATQFEGEHLL